MAEALRPKVMSQSDLARELGVSPQAVSGWIVGRSKPTPELMARIEDLLSIPMRAWTEEWSTQHANCAAATASGRKVAP